MEETTATLLAFAAGFSGGTVLGLAARLGRFCTLAAIEDALFAQNLTRWRMWVLAIAVAIVCLIAAEAAGLFAPGSAVVVASGFNPVSVVVGGLMFGIGMALVGTCGFGTLVQLGGGDLKSFVVFLVLGISAFMAATGPTASLHVWLLEPFTMSGGAFADPRIHVLLGSLSGLTPMIVALLIAASLIGWVMSDSKFRARPKVMLWSLIVGLTIAWGFLATGYFIRDPFEPMPVVSYTFIQPVGATVMYAMTSTGSQLSFGIGATVGVIAGAFFGALRKREWRWQTHDDAIEARRQIAGAALMGTGGMYALGCTFGQGLSAASVLALSAPIALASIWAGAYLGLLYLMEGGLGGLIQGLSTRGSASGKAPAE